MNEIDFERAKQKLKEKHNAALAADLESLERIYSIVKEDSVETIIRPRPKWPAQDVSVGKGDVLRGVKDIFAGSPNEEFTAQELTDRLLTDGINTTRASVNGAIVNLVEKEFVEMTVKGIGRRPGKYRKKP